MQNVIMYALASSTIGVVRDYANARGLNAPTFTRGCAVELKLRLFSETENPTAYPFSSLSEVLSWQCVFDNDFNQSTSPKIVADNSDIIAHEVTDTINGEERTFTEIVIPISDMNTQELIALLGNNASVSGLNMELVGFNGDADEVFILQIENFTVRNRIYYAGNPTDVPAEYLTAAQVKALVANTDISNVATKVLATSNANLLRSDCAVVRRTDDVSGDVTLAITSVKDANGNDVSLQDGFAYDWEYHLKADGPITSIAMGASMTAADVPETLALVGVNPTYHVFRIQGFYKSGAMNNREFLVSYKYSYEA